MKKLLVALTVSAAALCATSGAYAYTKGGSSGGNGACAICKQTNIGKVETTRINVSVGNGNVGHNFNTNAPIIGGNFNGNGSSFTSNVSQ